MGKHKPYFDYKPSGTPWFGQVPNRWRSTKMKYECRVNMGQSPSSDDCNAEGSGLPFLQGNAEFTSRYPKARQYCEVANKIAKRGELLLSVRAPVGALNEADQSYGIGRGLCSISPSTKIEKSFIWWLLPVIKAELDSVSTGSTFESVSAEQIENLRFFIPTQHEQSIIATFLDHETAKIDRLIARQERLIELLKEKRQAVISHAVTKGLNPDAPMKDSGVEWLGEVPAHWSLIRLGYFARVINGSTPDRNNSDYWGDGDVPWLSSGALNDYSISTPSEFITKKALAECSVEIIPEESVLVGLVGQGKTRGLSALLKIKATINQNVAAIIPKQGDLLSQFLHFFLQSIYEPLRDFGRGGNQAALNCELVAALRVVLPPIDEQVSIVKYIENKLRDLETLEEKAFTSIDLMHEHRTALISAAVTGKIDVRGWRQPNTEPQEAATAASA